MKKFLALLLAMTMVLSMGVTVMAEDGEGSGNGGTLPIDEFTGFTKNFVSNDGGSTPAASFAFTVANPTTYVDNEGNTQNVTTIPTVTVTRTAFTDGQDTGTIPVDIAVNDAPLGVYTYTITETDPKIAGVTIADPFYLVVTILRADGEKHYVGAMHLESATGEKKAEIDNEYDNGSLTVSKTVTGNMADVDKYFPFTVTFTPVNGTTIASTITVAFNGGDATDPSTSISATDGEKYTVSGNTYTFNLKHDETVLFSNVPEGVTYAVTETDPGEYTQTTTADTGTINGDITAEFVNELGADIDTGINMDSVPYYVMIAIVIAAAAVFFMKRRASIEE